MLMRRILLPPQRAPRQGWEHGERFKLLPTSSWVWGVGREREGKTQSHRSPQLFDFPCFPPHAASRRSQSTVRLAQGLELIPSLGRGQQLAQGFRKSRSSLERCCRRGDMSSSGPFHLESLFKKVLC